MKFTNKLNLPSPFVKAIENLNKSYTYETSGDISTTTLIAPPQIVALTKRYENILEEDVSNRLWALQGQILHAVLEEAEEDKSKVENRVAMNVLGWKVTGKYDLIEGQTLFDYKYTSVWAYIFGHKEWALQANVNRYLLHCNGVVINKLQNVLMFRDFDAKRVGTNKYPATMVLTVDLPMWSLEEAEQYIGTRVKLHQEAQLVSDENLPECSDDERWYNARTKKYNRCAKYCPVAQFCTQLKESSL